jgi:hypothetical protein
MAQETSRACKGDLSMASQMSTSRAICLDAIFSEIGRRAEENAES